MLVYAITKTCFSLNDERTNFPFTDDEQRLFAAYKILKIFFDDRSTPFSFILYGVAW